MYDKPLDPPEPSVGKLVMFVGIGLLLGVLLLGIPLGIGLGVSLQNARKSSSSSPKILTIVSDLPMATAGLDMKRWVQAETMRLEDVNYTACGGNYFLS